MSKILNAGQDAAAEAFFRFLFEPQSEMIVSGPGGTGKTYLMGHMIDEIMPRYLKTCELMNIKPQFDQVMMTATTNKAAEVLGRETGRPSSTVHSFLNLSVRGDYETGETKLTPTTAWKVHENTILFVDETTMVDPKLKDFVRQGTHNCKIVWVGDHCQLLSPMMDLETSVYADNLGFYELTEPMRTKDPVLQAVNQQLRRTVETGRFEPIKIIPGTIDWLDDTTMEETIDRYFADPTQDARILAYTNARVNSYNDHIRQLRGLPAHATANEILINNNAMRLGKQMLRVEEEITILKVADETNLVSLPGNAQLEVREATIRTHFGHVLVVKLPEDREHFHALVRYYARQKDWKTHFHLKENYPDLRPRDASTVYKAQGSTYDTVFIDLGNISACPNPDQAARMLYVAFSRAKSQIYLYGQLADRFGGILTPENQAAWA